MKYFLLHSRKLATTTQVRDHQNISHDPTIDYQYYKQVRKGSLLGCPDSITILVVGITIYLPGEDTTFTSETLTSQDSFLGIIISQMIKGSQKIMLPEEHLNLYRLKELFLQP